MFRPSRLIVIVTAGGLSCAGTQTSNPPPPEVITVGNEAGGEGSTDGPPGSTPGGTEEAPEVVSTLPPLAEREAAKSTAPLPDTPTAGIPYSAALNPADSAGRTIYLSGSGEDCYVELPFPPGELVPPGTAPPRQPVTCPEAMADPAWLSCKTGTIQSAGPDITDACICHVMGNPPPPPWWVHCPAG